MTRDNRHVEDGMGFSGFAPTRETPEERLLVKRTAERDAERAKVARLRGALEEYLYQTTHLATPQTVGEQEYRRALIPYSEIEAARAALKDTADA